MTLGDRIKEFLDGPKPKPVQSDRLGPDKPCVKLPLDVVKHEAGTWGRTIITFGVGGVDGVTKFRISVEPEVAAILPVGSMVLLKS